MCDILPVTVAQWLHLPTVQRLPLTGQGLPCLHLRLPRHPLSHRLRRTMTLAACPRRPAASLHSPHAVFASALASPRLQTLARNVEERFVQPIACTQPGTCTRVWYRCRQPDHQLPAQTAPVQVQVQVQVQAQAQALVEAATSGQDHPSITARGVPHRECARTSQCNGVRAARECSDRCSPAQCDGCSCRCRCAGDSTVHARVVQQVSACQVLSHRRRMALRRAVCSSPSPSPCRLHRHAGNPEVEIEARIKGVELPGQRNGGIAKPGFDAVKHMLDSNHVRPRGAVAAAIRLSDLCCHTPAVVTHSKDEDLGPGVP